MYDRNPPARLQAKNRATGESPSEQLLRLMRTISQEDFENACAVSAGTENETLKAIMAGLEAWRAAFMQTQPELFSIPAAAPARKPAPAPAPKPRGPRAVQLDLFEE